MSLVKTKAKTTITSPIMALINVLLALAKFSFSPPEVSQVKAPNKAMTKKIKAAPIMVKGRIIFKKEAMFVNFAGAKLLSEISRA